MWVPGTLRTRAASAHLGSAPSAAASRRLQSSSSSTQGACLRPQYACAQSSLPEATIALAAGSKASSAANASGPSPSAHSKRSARRPRRRPRRRVRDGSRRLHPPPVPDDDRPAAPGLSTGGRCGTVLRPDAVAHVEKAIAPARRRRASVGAGGGPFGRDLNAPAVEIHVCSRAETLRGSPGPVPGALAVRVAKAAAAWGPARRCELSARGAARNSTLPTTS